jgi:Xaa-Pro aminopeptidase
MDVHDTAQVPRNIPLQPGMVITVEPGLYIPRSSKFLPTNRSEFAGIGIRIEDDVLITVKENKQLSCEVLSSNCPKTVSEIEELMTA